MKSPFLLLAILTLSAGCMLAKTNPEARAMADRLEAIHIPELALKNATVTEAFDQALAATAAVNPAYKGIAVSFDPEILKDEEVLKHRSSGSTTNNTALGLIQFLSSIWQLKYEFGKDRIVLHLAPANARQIRGNETDADTEQMQRAVFAGDYHAAAALLAAHPTLANASFARNSMTVLRVAAERGDLAMVNLLLSHNADIESMWSDASPLADAAGKGRREVVALLLAKGADVEDGDRKNPLIAAARGDHTDLVGLLLAHDADVNRADANGSSLHAAAYNGNTRMAALLLAAGADVNARRDTGDTPLHNAAAASHKKVVDLLLENKATPGAIGFEGFTPLLRAAIEGDPKVIESLLAAGADINARTDKGRTALMWAAAMNRKDAIAVLRKHGAKE